MATSPRIRNTPGCEIELQGEHLRVAVGPALSDEVQECYHAFANECVTRTCNRVLIIGNAAGTTARALSVLYPGARVDGVELDPVVSELGREYLGEGAVRGLHVVAADGRAYLTTTAQRYDLIVVDAYRQTYIPFYMTTQENHDAQSGHESNAREVR